MITETEVPTITNEPELRIKFYTMTNGVGYWHGKLTTLRKTHLGAKVLSLQTIDKESINEE